MENIQNGITLNTINGNTCTYSVIYLPNKDIKLYNIVVPNKNKQKR